MADQTDTITPYITNEAPQQQAQQASFFPSSTDPMEPKASFISTTVPNFTSDKTADDRANRYDGSLGPALSPGVDAIRSNVLSGLEDNLRRNAMARDRNIQDTANQQYVASFIKERAAAGQPLSVEDIGKLTSQLDGKPYALEGGADHSAYLERKQADKIVETAVSTVEPADDNNDANTIAARKLYAANPGLKDYLTRNALLNKVVEDTEDKYKGTSWGGTVVNFASTTVVPLLGNFYQVNRIPGYDAQSWLVGNNIEEQSKYLHDLPPEEAARKLQATIDGIFKWNPTAAVEYAHKMADYSSSSKVLDNIFGLIDVGVAGQIGVGIATGVARGSLRSLVPTLIKQGGSRGGSIPGVLDATGAVADAGYQNALNTVKALSKEAGAEANSFDTLRNAVPPIFDVDAIKGPAGTTPFSSTVTQNLMDALKSQATGLLEKTLVSPINIARVQRGAPEYAELMANTMDAFIKQYPGASNSVIHVGVMNSEANALSNTDHIVIGLGKNNGDLFGSVNAARQTARLMGLKDAAFTIEARGVDKFYIQMVKAVDETAPSVRHSIAINTEKTPTSLANRLFGYVRSRDELIPSDLNKEVKIATFGTEQISHLATAIMERAIADVPKGGLLRRASDRADLTRFLEAQRITHNPATGSPGVFSPTLADFARDWGTMHGRLPTPEITKAYFTYQQVNDIEYAQRNLNILKGKQRVGAEMHTLQAGFGGVRTPALEGKFLPAGIPWQEAGDFGVLVWDNAGKKHQYVRRKYTPVAGTANRLGVDNINDLVANKGYKVIHLSSWAEDALRASPLADTLPKGRIHYIVAKDAKSSPLEFNQIPYKPGGHLEYADNFFTSQPKISKYQVASEVSHDYRGDQTIFAHRTSEQGAKVTNAMEQARLLYQAGDKQGLRAFLNKADTPLPYAYKDFVRLFKGKTATFDLDTPFLLRQRGKTTLDLHSKDLAEKYGFTNMEDARKGAHDLYHDNINIKHAMERDTPINNVVNTGTALSPTFNAMPARQLDPFISLNRAAVSMAKAKYMDDLKIKAAERFVQEFGQHVDMTPEELARYPMRALSPQTPLKRGNAVDAESFAAAKNYKRTVNEFLGASGENDRLVMKAVNTLDQFLLDSLGDVKGAKVADYLENNWAFNQIKDPSAFLRKAAFIPKMGFWNPKQLFMQAQGAIATAAQAGLENAAKGMSMAYMMRPLQLAGTDAIITEAAARAEKALGVKAKHFIESYEALQRTGFQNVGGEYGSFDAHLNPNVANSTLNKMFDDSMMFFKMGERANRLTAWNAAYLVWREANPLRVFDNQAVKQVLAQADQYTGNMTRASAAGWNYGWASIPTQFFSYHARVMDQMLGGRLDRDQKVKMMALHSIMYGIPAGTAGLAVGGVLPVAQLTSDLMKNYGIDPDSNVVSSTLAHGIPQAMLGMLVGDQHKAPSISDTLGPNGVDAFYNLVVKGDASKLVGAGPATLYKSSTALTQLAGELVWNGWSTESNLMLAMHYGSTHEKFPTVWGTWKPLMDTISTVSNVEKSIYAVNLGKYYNKQGQTISDHGSPDWVNGISSLLLGTDPQTVKDFYTTLEVKKAQQKVFNDNQTRAMDFYRAAFKAESSEDAFRYTLAAQQHMTLAGMTYQQKHDTYQKALEGYETIAVQAQKRLDNMSVDRQRALIKKIGAGQ